MTDLKTLTPEEQVTAIKAVAAAVGWAYESPAPYGSAWIVSPDEPYSLDRSKDRAALVLALWDEVSRQWGATWEEVVHTSPGWHAQIAHEADGGRGWSYRNGGFLSPYFATELDARLALLAKVVAEVPKPEKEGGE